MPFIEWSKEYETGNRDVDVDHRGLFALINDLHDKMEDGAAEASVGVTIGALEDYVKIHFDREETLLTACGYKDLERHKAVHRNLEAQVAAYRSAYEDDPAAFDMAGFMEFLSEWLTHHILKTDMAYVPFVKGRVSDIKAE